MPRCARSAPACTSWSSSRCAATGFGRSPITTRKGTVNVLNLVEGDEVEIASPTGAFAPYPVHYAETVIVPAEVGPYVIRRTSTSRSERFATVKAYVRGTLAGEN